MSFTSTSTSTPISSNSKQINYTELIFNKSKRPNRKRSHDETEERKSQQSFDINKIPTNDTNNIQNNSPTSLLCDISLVNLHVNSENNQNTDDVFQQEVFNPSSWSSHDEKYLPLYDDSLPSNLHKDMSPHSIISDSLQDSGSECITSTGISFDYEVSQDLDPTIRSTRVDINNRKRRKILEHIANRPSFHPNSSDLAHMMKNDEGNDPDTIARNVDSDLKDGEYHNSLYKVIEEIEAEGEVEQLLYTTDLSSDNDPTYIS